MSITWCVWITNCFTCLGSRSRVAMGFNMSRLNSLMASSKLVHLELAWVSVHCSAICIVVSHPGFKFSFLKENCRRGKLNLKVCAYVFLC